MKILKGDKGNIDFQHPLRLDKLQRERFINFLREMFHYVEEKEVKEFRDKRIGEKNFQREWDEEEYGPMGRPKFYEAMSGNKVKKRKKK